MQACNTLKGWGVRRLNEWRSLRYVNREVCCFTVKSIYYSLIEHYMVKKNMHVCSVYCKQARFGLTKQ